MGPVKLLVRALRSRWVMWAGFGALAAFVLSCVCEVHAAPTRRTAVDIAAGRLAIIRVWDPAESTNGAFYIRDRSAAGPFQWVGLFCFMPSQSDMDLGSTYTVVPWGWCAILLGVWSAYLFGFTRGRSIANPDACRRCGYPLAGGDPGARRTCPECGTGNASARVSCAVTPDGRVPSSRASVGQMPFSF